MASSGGAGSDMGFSSRHGFGGGSSRTWSRMRLMTFLMRIQSLWLPRTSAITQLQNEREFLPSVGRTHSRPPMNMLRFWITSERGRFRRQSWGYLACFRSSTLSIAAAGMPVYMILASSVYACFRDLYQRLTAQTNPNEG